MLICDFHNDVLTGCDNPLSQLNIYEKLSYKVVTAYFRGGNSIAKAVCDINKYLSVGLSSCYLALEDIGYPEINKLDKLLNFFPIYASLTWNGENIMGYGCDYQSKGLKEEGKQAIKKLNQYQICLDCSHLSRKGFFEAIDIADSVVISHTAFNKVFAHKRNVTDEQIILTLQKGGIIGLALYNEFLSDKPVGEIDCVIRQIDYFVNKFGCDGLCIGTDYFGAKNFVAGINNYEKTVKIVEKLQKIGYNKEVIEKIFYFNLNNFLEKVNGRKRFIY